MPKMRIIRICAFAFLWMYCLSLRGQAMHEYAIVDLDSLESFFTPKIDTIKVLKDKVERIEEFNKQYEGFDAEYRKINWAYSDIKGTIAFIAICLSFCTICIAVMSIFGTYQNTKRRKELGELIKNAQDEFNKVKETKQKIDVTELKVNETEEKLKEAEKKLDEEVKSVERKIKENIDKLSNEAQKRINESVKLITTHIENASKIIARSEKMTEKSEYQAEQKLSDTTEIINSKIALIEEKVKKAESIIKENTEGAAKELQKARKQRKKLTKEVSQKLQAFLKVKEDVGGIDLQKILELEAIPDETKKLLKDFRVKYSDLEKDGLSYKYDSKDFYTLGLANFYDTKYDDAIDYLRVSQDRGYERKVWILSKIGACLYKQGYSEDALVQLEEALKINPNYASALYNKGVILKAKAEEQKGEMQTQAYEHVLSIFEQVLSINQNHIPAKNNKGLLLIELKRYEEGIAVFDEITQNGKRYALAHYNLAAIYSCIDEVKVKDISKAFTHLEESFKIDPLKRIKRAIDDDDLKSLKSHPHDNRFVKLIIKYNLETIGKMK